MCRIAEELENKGIEKGLKQGLEQGRTQEKINNYHTVNRCMNFFHSSFEEALTCVQITVEQYFEGEKLYQMHGNVI